jgi:electron transfer flavoprotein alpha subunit
VETEINAPTAIVAILPGSFKKEKGETTAAAKVKIRNSPVPLDSLKTKFCSVIEPPKGDVDITQQAVLVSVGRGIQNKENIQVAEELAKLLNGVVSASRPVVDQGWLPLTRLVGRSGMLVKPKLYFALGISGAPEHVEGMKNSSTIIAVNTDPKAPIFSIADYGVVCDLFDVANALIEKLRKNL